MQSVHFESLPGVDRVVLTLGRKVPATQFEPDPSTLIVLLKGAMIDAQTERRVDTKEFGGPVEMFSVFKTPDVSYARGPRRSEAQRRRRRPS